MIGYTARAVRLPQAVVGYRAWVLNGEGRLCSTWKPHVWESATERARSKTSLTDAAPRDVARCRLSHRPPELGCTCGLYAWYGLERAHWSGRWLCGAVVAWGRLAIHALGFRAQHMRIVALAAPPFDPSALRVERATCRRVASEYGVPLVAREQLRDFALEYGMEVPVEARPEA